ncbi:MAG: hypothetical protein ABEI77_09775 [Halorientalis sp.]
MSNTPERDNTDQQLSRVCDALGIPETTAQTARDRHERVRSVTVLEDKRDAVVGAAVLSLTAREAGLPITVATIADAWSNALDGQGIEPDEITSLFGVLTANLAFQGTPPQPRALIERFGKDLGLPDGIIVVANRILVDVFTEDPTMIAEGTSPDGIAGSILYLAAKLNGYEDISESDISDTLGTGQFTVQNRGKKIRDTLGKERMATDDRYHLDPQTGAPKAADTPAEPPAQAPTNGQQSPTPRADGAAESPRSRPTDPTPRGRRTTLSKTPTRRHRLLARLTTLDRPLTLPTRRRTVPRVILPKPMPQGRAKPTRRSRSRAIRSFATSRTSSSRCSRTNSRRPNTSPRNLTFPSRRPGRRSNGPRPTATSNRRKPGRRSSGFPATGRI